MTKNRGLYLMRYNTTNIKSFVVLNEKNNFYCIEHRPDWEHRWGKVGFKFGRTSNIKKRLEYYKNNKEGIKYNLIKFFPCNNEKIREDKLKSHLDFICQNWYRWETAEHIPSEYISLKEILEEVDFYSNAKMIKDYKCSTNYRFELDKEKKDIKEPTKKEMIEALEIFGFNNNDFNELKKHLNLL